MNWSLSPDAVNGNTGRSVLVTPGRSVFAGAGNALRSNLPLAVSGI